MAELCSFYCKFIFSKASCGSHDIIQNIPLESKQITVFFFRRVKAVSQEAFFCKWQVLEFFFENFNPIFHEFFVNKIRTIFFFQKSSPGSLAFFLHKHKFEQNRSSAWYPRNLDYRFQMQFRDKRVQSFRCGEQWKKHIWTCTLKFLSHFNVSFFLIFFFCCRDRRDEISHNSANFWNFFKKILRTYF